MKRMNKLTLTVCAWLLPCLCMAQNTTDGESRDSIQNGMAVDRTATKPVGLAPYIGLGAGYVPENDQLEVEGAASQLKLLGSFYPQNQRSVFDLGYGVMNERFQNDDAVVDDSVTSGVLEVGARYQWSNRWQAGLVGNTFFDKGTAYGANQSDMQFAGLHVIKEVGLRNGSLMRFGARAMQDLNVNTQEVYLAMFDFQFGWNPERSRRMAAAEGTAEIADTSTEFSDMSMDTATDPTPATTFSNDSVNSPTSDVMNPSTDVGAGVTAGIMSTPSLAVHEVQGDTAFITFESGSSDLDDEQRAKVEELANVLADSRDLFDSIEVVGHADRTGSEDYNIVLSTQRAQAVADVLEEQGLMEDDIFVSGRGSSEPQMMGAAAEDSGANRRVELILTGVTDEKALTDALVSIQ